MTIKEKIIIKNEERSNNELLPDNKSIGENQNGILSQENKERKKVISADKVYATGKRKTAIAKVWMSKRGNGHVMVNGKSIQEYFKRAIYRMIIKQPFDILKAQDSYDIKCQVSGSGLSGQAGAIKHGISKALAQVSESFYRTLKSGGFLTRDSRKVERKKYGRPKARKKFQFSKR